EPPDEQAARGVERKTDRAVEAGLQGGTAIATGSTEAVARHETDDARRSLDLPDLAILRHVQIAVGVECELSRVRDVTLRGRHIVDAEHTVGAVGVAGNFTEHVVTAD